MISNLSPKSGQMCVRAVLKWHLSFWVWLVPVGPRSIWMKTLWAFLPTPRAACRKMTAQGSIHLLVVYDTGPFVEHLLFFLAGKKSLLGPSAICDNDRNWDCPRTQLVFSAIIQFAMILKNDFVINSPVMHFLIVGKEKPGMWQMPEH